jgi:putative tricarboxylic transport membrane protein
MLDLILLGVGEVFQPIIILYIALGVLAGFVVGCIPGLTVTAGVALTLPLTYGLSPIAGISAMMGVFVGSMSGGLISAILLGIPGTSASIATTFDGYPMAKRGEVGRALGLGITSSFAGGMLAGLLLLGTAPLIAKWGLSFGPWEYFSLTVFALTIIGSLAGENLLKGLQSGILGLMLATVGVDQFLGVERFTFGYHQLAGGFTFIPVLIGLYAFSKIMGNLQGQDTFQYDGPVDLWSAIHQVIADLRSSYINVLRSTLIGTFVGILPAAGGSIANILSYDQAKKASRNKDEFGKGCADGVIAAETANNALAGGALIPTLALGMPGDAATAVMLGALMLHGIQPGPLLFTNQPRLSYGIIIAYLVANVFMFIFLILGIQFFSRINQVAQHILFPYVLIFCTIGTLALNNRLFDVWVLFLFGILGYVLTANDYPLPPLVLGLILGPMAETNLRRALMTDPTYWPFITRPISLLLLLLALGSLIFSLWPHLKKQKSPIQKDPLSAE